MRYVYKESSHRFLINYKGGKGTFIKENYGREHLK